MGEFNKSVFHKIITGQEYLDLVKLHKISETDIDDMLEMIEYCLENYPLPDLKDVENDSRKSRRDY